MATVVIHNPRFDVVEYIKKLRNAGVSQEIAEVQAQEMEHVIESVLEQAKNAIDNKELATKHDIKELELKIEQTKAEIHKSKYDIVIWVAGLLIANGVITHLLKFI